MAFQKSSANTRSTTRLAKGELILGVGGHAFVNDVRDDRSQRGIPATDMGGDPVANDLRDGEEVEILAWRPHARHGLSYQVRRLSDGRECWIRASYLRRTANTAAA